MRRGNDSPPMTDPTENGCGQVGVTSFKTDWTFLRGQSPYIHCPTRVPIIVDSVIQCMFCCVSTHPASNCVKWGQKSTQSSTPSLSGCSSLRPQIRSYINTQTHTSTLVYTMHTHIHTRSYTSLYTFQFLSSFFFLRTISLTTVFHTTCLLALQEHQR